MKLNTVSMVHEFLRRNVREGAFCIDATAGKGRDTALLCQLAGEKGRVLTFDIQEDALVQTERLLQQKGLSAQLIHDSHANIAAYAPPGSVDCIVFNFGRLPGGDPFIFTHADTSVAAVRASLDLLAPSGVMALAVYYGGPNGYRERDALLSYLRGVDSRQYTVLVCSWINRTGDSPFPIFIWKENGINE